MEVHMEPFKPAITLHSLIATHPVFSLLPKVSINEAMISRCTGKNILLADATKVANIHQFSVAKADVFDLLITDFRVQKEQLEDFKYTSLAIQTVHPFYGYQSVDQ